jgi:hypothetical protein
VEGQGKSHLFPVILATAVTGLDCAFTAERTPESHLSSKSPQGNGRGPYVQFAR